MVVGLKENLFVGTEYEKSTSNNPMVGRRM